MAAAARLTVLVVLHSPRTVLVVLPSPSVHETSAVPLVWFDMILKLCPDLSKYYYTIWYDSKIMSRLVTILWYDLIQFYMSCNFKLHMEKKTYLCHPLGCKLILALGRSNGLQYSSGQICAQIERQGSPHAFHLLIDFLHLLREKLLTIGMV